MLWPTSEANLIGSSWQFVVDNRGLLDEKHYAGGTSRVN